MWWWWWWRWCRGGWWHFIDIVQQCQRLFMWLTTVRCESDCEKLKIRKHTNYKEWQNNIHTHHTLNVTFKCDDNDDVNKSTTNILTSVKTHTQLRIKWMNFRIVNTHATFNTHTHQPHTVKSNSLSFGLYIWINISLFYSKHWMSNKPKNTHMGRARPKTKAQKNHIQNAHKIKRKKKKNNNNNKFTKRKRLTSN